MLEIEVIVGNQFTFATVLSKMKVRELYEALRANGEAGETKTSTNVFNRSHRLSPL